MSDLPVVLGNLSPAAAAAATATAAEVLADWFDRSLRSPASRRRYGLGFRAFAGWLRGTTYEAGRDAEAANTVADWLVALQEIEDHAAAQLPLGRRLRADQTARVVCRNTLLRFRAEREAAGKAPSSIAGDLSVVSSLTKALQAAGLLAFTVERVLPRIEPVEDRSGPREADVGRMLRGIDEAAPDSPRAVRDAALVRMLFNELLRRAEVVNLEVEHVRRTDLGVALLVHGKGRTSREPVLLSAPTVEALEAWLQVRGDAPGPLFCRVDKSGQLHPERTLHPSSIALVVRDRAERAGLRDHVRPHGLRHSGATALLRAGGTITELQAAGRWRSLSAASRYIDQGQVDRLRGTSRFAQ